MATAGIEMQEAAAATLLAEAAAQLAAQAIDSPRLTAEVLLAFSLGCTRSALYARLADPVPPAAAARFAAVLARRRQRQPLQYLVGEQPFWALDFIVTPDVLIPRPETEQLVESALATFAGARDGQALLVCDIGTGSGCLAISLAHEWPGACVSGLDLSAAALRVAAVNAARHGMAGRVRLLQSDLFAALDDAEVFDLIVANPPYVADHDLADAQPELAYEPRLALAAGDDGLNVIRRLLGEVPRRLRRGGWLLMEIGADQRGAVLDLAAQGGAVVAMVENDYAGLPRLLRAQW